jgi:hypothetical protein
VNHLLQALALALQVLQRLPLAIRVQSEQVRAHAAVRLGPDAAQQGIEIETFDPVAVGRLGARLDSGQTVVGEHPRHDHQQQQEPEPREHAVANGPACHC